MHLILEYQYIPIETILNKLWHGWGLWNANIWFYHHVLNHHSFTGEDKLDPDFIIYNHLRIKMELENPKNYII